MPNFNTFIKRLKGSSSSSSSSPNPDTPDLDQIKRRSRDLPHVGSKLVEVKEFDVISPLDPESNLRPIKGKKIGSSRLILGLLRKKSSHSTHKFDTSSNPPAPETMRSIASAAALSSKPSEPTLHAKGRIPLRMSECSLATYRAMLPSKLSEMSLSNYWALSRYSSTVSFTSCASTAAFKLHCKLCLCDIPNADMYELQDCKCVFCKSCMTQYVNIHIMEGNVLISCPDAQCERKGVLSCTEVESLLDKNSFDRYLRFKFNSEVDTDPSRTWCPRPGCENVCAVKIDSSKSSDNPREVLCSKCSFCFCSRCRRTWHPNKTCEEFAKIHAAQSLLEIGIAAAGNDSLVIKRCPVCRVPIERNEGCAQMMCRRCKHVFCWYCLASLDDDFLLRHYDKGPCKNKLGHSRASIIWHRTQVVGIFAGFTILLLVASPLLLLAAPCILCCKCSGCNRYCDEDSETSASLQ